MTLETNVKIGMTGLCFLLAVGFVGAQTPPIQVGDAKQLFIDELFFAEKKGVRLVINPPVKDKTPVLRADKNNPWEANRISSSITVLPVDGGYRLYYDAIAPCPSDDRSRWMCVATSVDGIHFEKPKLGIIPFEDRNDTNIVWPPTRDPGHEPGNVFLDTNPNCPPEEKYKMVGSFGGGTSMAYSADGLRFTAYGKPSFRPSDTMNKAFFDERIGRYVGIVRAWDGGRKVGRCEFDDPRNWGEEQIIFSYDEQDTRYLDKKLFAGMDHYVGGMWKYPGAENFYFMFPAAYYHFHTKVAKQRGRGGTRSPGNDGNLEAQLAASRDGIQWQRPTRDAFLPLGIYGSWDGGRTQVTGDPLIVGNEIWIYYQGAEYTHGDYALDQTEALGCVMRAVHRLDGFVSVDAGFEPGEFKTPPLVFDGKQLELNVNTGGGGWLLVELQDEQGQPIPGFTLADCDTCNGNYLDYVVSWNGNTDLSKLAGKPVRMRMRLRGTKLYAFQYL